MSDELFTEIKDAAIKIWSTYDDTYGYASEKIAYVNSISNKADNWGGIVGMLDHVNQRMLYNAVSPEAQAFVDKWVGGLDRIEALAKKMGL